MQQLKTALTEFLAANENNWLRYIYIESPTNHGSDEGFLSGDLKQKLLEASEFDDAERFYHDTEKDNFCFKSDGTEHYLIAIEQPQDAWGNKVYNELGSEQQNAQLETVSNCWEIAFNDDYLTEIYVSFDDDDDEEYDFRDDFFGWLQENVEKYDCLSKVCVPSRHNERDYDITYYTTNKPAESKEWQQIKTDFYASVR